MTPSRTALITLLCIAWILPGLVGHDPWKPDEADTFGVVYSILEGGSWVVPHIAGEPFLERPPLFYLTAAASARVFSGLFPLHDAARLITGLWMALTFVFVGAAARELHGDGRGGIAVLLLLGCFGLVVRSHQLITDVAMLTGFAMAYYGWTLILRRPAAGGLWTGTGIGIAFLANGLLPLAIAGSIALVLPLVSHSWRNRGYASALIMASLAAAPWLIVWPLLLYGQSPALFERWLWDHNIGAYLGKVQGLDRGSTHYFEILPWYAFPAWLLALWALWRARGPGLVRPAVVVPVTGFAMTLAWLSGSADARELLALPLLLPVALLAVPAPDTLRRGASNAWYWFGVMAFSFFIAAFWFYWSGLELGVPARLHAHLHRIRPGYTPGFRWLPFVLGILYTAAWCLVLWRLERNAERPLLTWAAGITAMWGVLATLFLGWVDTTKTYRNMITSLQLALPKQFDCIASRGLGEPQRAMLHYFAGIITYREEGPRQRGCELILVQGVPQYEVIPRGSWTRIWEGSRPRDKDEHFRLYRRAEPPAKPKG
ncbi:MAG TPA: glycosyltransferase family 39 protein [Burkholderiales bacterium]|jgi:4-amino-4-deoxy-L-arabinose transferase-like glycosyltransferase|nr:glycosyltransferase family 39 protein [Burkholderiales bacterium]